MRAVPFLVFVRCGGHLRPAGRRPAGCPQMVRMEDTGPTHTIRLRDASCICVFVCWRCQLMLDMLVKVPRSGRYTTVVPGVCVFMLWFAGGGA